MTNSGDVSAPRMGSSGFGCGLEKIEFFLTCQPTIQRFQIVSDLLGSRMRASLSIIR